ncbi:PQQ-binding-like beta-propeller repeat protein [Undibacterium sp. Di26W]|uniref:outer membrane protein assembly factor BamB family protein n=1 Tax=Undibacterium sp. Di26W TaxID=3413035 RepID=UPI003BF33E3D
MKNIKKLTSFLLLSLLLTGCGGGSGGGAGTGTNTSTNTGTSTGTSTTNSGNPVDTLPVVSNDGGLSFTPSSLTATILPYENKTLSLDIRANRNFPDVVNVAIIDTTGVITDDIRIKAFDKYNYQASVTTRSLKPGRYSGILEVRLCKDSPYSCAQPHEGSPWKLPYSFEVRAPSITISPAEITASFVPAEEKSFELEIRSEAGIDFINRVGVSVTDPAGLLTNGNAVTKIDKNTIRTTIRMTSKPPVGKYVGALEVRLCGGNINSCDFPYQINPWKIPYNLEVKTNTSTLSPTPGAADWNGYQGNVAHTGYVPVTLNVNAFSPRFLFEIDSKYMAQGQITTQGDTVYFSAPAANGGIGGAVFAVNESDGKVKWTFPVADGWVNPPAAQNGKVYFMNTGTQSSGLWVLDQSNGNRLGKTNVITTSSYFYAPVVDGQTVFSRNGPQNQFLSSSSADTLSSNWNFASDNMDALWSPAVDTNYVYMFVTKGNTGGPGGLAMINRQSGKQTTLIAAPDIQASMTRVEPTLCDGVNLLIASNGLSLVNFDLASQKIKWTVKDTFYSNPVCAGSTLYILNGYGVDARSLSTGALLWQWKFPDGVYYDQKPIGANGYLQNMIVTNNVLLVGSFSAVFAVDLSSHQTVWSYPRGGDLALSKNGILYVNKGTSGYGSFMAFNTK